MKNILTNILFLLRIYKICYFSLIFAAFGLPSFGQNQNKTTEKDDVRKLPDTITVNYGNSDLIGHNGKPQFYINNVFFGDNLPVFDMASKDVNDVTIDGDKIKISIIKDINEYQFISLKELSEAYFKPTDGSIIFMLNGEFLKDELNNYKIDRKYILSINILDKNNFKYLQSTPVYFKIVNIKTRTNENIKAANTVYIR